MTPVPLKSTGAEFLWGAIMLFGECGKISQAIEKLFLVSDLNVKIRQLDSASGNRRFIAHELSQLSIHTLMLIFWYPLLLSVGYMMESRIGYSHSQSQLGSSGLSMDIHGHPHWLFVKFGMPLLIPASQNSQLAGYTS